MALTLLQQAKELATQSGLVGNETYEEVTSRANKQLTEHVAGFHCPILTEMILTNYSHPLSLTSADAAKVIMNHAKEPIWLDLPVPDIFAQNLYHSRRKSPGLWTVLCIEFTNIFRTVIYFVPARAKNMGFEIVVYDIETRMYSNYHDDLPRQVAVDIMSRDPRILSGIKE